VATLEKPIFTVQVREVVAFVLRRGDLGGERDFVGPHRALAGIRGHQKLQRARPSGYQKEVRVGYEVEAGEFRLRIQGRIDGLLVSAEGALVEEIKTTQGGWNGVADPLHWAQAKFYGFIYAHDNSLQQVDIQLSYVDLDTGKLSEFREEFAFPVLKSFFEETTAFYVEWLRERYHWRQQRDASIKPLAFPFAEYRPGQRQLAVATYRTLEKGGRLYLEAPTGIGKTISVLFPAVKAMAEGKLERLFYLTARTLGRTVAEKAFQDLRAGGLRFCTLTLTAKERICVQPDGRPCDPAVCPLARGYYDRVLPAMREALQREEITRPVLEAVSQAHQVCPFELSLDLSLWVDAVICDYNYVFDPKVYLRRHFAEEGGDYTFLVDEAHNLVDRAREMFSAELEVKQIREVRRAIKETLPRAARALNRLSSAMRKLGGTTAPTEEAQDSESPESPELELGLFKAAATPQGAALWQSVAQPQEGASSPQPSSPEEERGKCGLQSVPNSAEMRYSAATAGERGEVALREFPAELTPLLEAALKEAEVWLAQNEPAGFREALLELYFQLLSFARTAELYDEHYVTIVEPGAGARVRLFCLDPSYLLRQALARGRAAVFFSATLTPLEYYRELLGGSPEDPTLRLPSPFPPENLATLVQDRIRTDFKTRGQTLEEVAQAIGAVLEGRAGNYLVYFPSYQYLNAVRERFEALYPGIHTLVQQPRMGEAERESFLAEFSVEHGETLAGFAVMGGIFGEGIDLVGERLIGAIIVGVGLPQLCFERSLIRGYFEAKTGQGFEYAYTFPGMNRVLQATGRVIRSETDRGVALLIDARFGAPRYRRLFPEWWRPVVVRNTTQIREALSFFWSSSSSSSSSSS
jgi:DNA excision repair protein ERCC-2